MSGKGMKSAMSRRDFLASTAAVAAFTIVPRHVLGGPGYTPPSEKLNIAAIGAGGRGAGDIGAVSSENIVALCDVDDKKAAETFEHTQRQKNTATFAKCSKEKRTLTQ